jgi:hypothetical protein
MDAQRRFASRVAVQLPRKRSSDRVRAGQLRGFSHDAILAAACLDAHRLERDREGGRLLAGGMRRNLDVTE